MQGALRIALLPHSARGAEVCARCGAELFEFLRVGVQELGVYHTHGGNELVRLPLNLPTTSPDALSLTATLSLCRPRLSRA